MSVCLFTLDIYWLHCLVQTYTKNHIHKIPLERILILSCKGIFFPKVGHMLNIRCCTRLN